MALTELNVSIAAQGDGNIQCNGSDSEQINAIVKVKTDGNSATVAVSLWDWDPTGDTQITEKELISVPGNYPGDHYRDYASFILSCTSSCFVAGNLADTGEPSAGIYAWFEEWDTMLNKPVMGGKTAETQALDITCVS